MNKLSEKPDVYTTSVKQRYMLDITEDESCPEDLRNLWTLAHALLVKPRIDVRRLRRAVDKLAKRHDSLRIKFDKVKGNWRAFVYPTVEDLVQQIDLGDLDDAAFSEQITALANAPMAVRGVPLAQFLVVSCGARGDVLITRVHHAITDGFGMIVLSEDLLKLLIGLPILGKAVSFGEYISKWHLPPPSRASEFDAFWERLHEGITDAPPVGRLGKGLKPLVACKGEMQTRWMQFKATSKSLKALEAKAKAAKVSPVTLITAGNSEAICNIYGLDKVFRMLCVGRTEPGLATYIGDHTLDPIVPFISAGSGDIVSAAQRFAQTIGQAMEHMPSDKCMRGSDYFYGLAANGGHPEQFCVYQPRAVVREGRSVLGEGFFANFGDEFKLGPYSLSQVDVETNSRALSEYQINLGGDRDLTGFKLEYDDLAYTADEINALGTKTCDLLGLELREVRAG